MQMNKILKTLHNKLTNKVLHAPISFFDSNPVGRIITSFTKDLVNLDELFYELIISQMLVMHAFSILTIGLAFCRVPDVDCVFHL